MSLWSFLKAKMLDNPCSTVCENSTEMSFKDICMLAESFGKKLNGLRCCAVLCKSEMMTAISLLACFSAGVCAVPLSERYGKQYNDKIIRSVGPDAIITDDGGALGVINVTTPSFCEPSHHPALIMCSSGTSGAPKRIMLSEKGIIANVNDIALYFKIGKTDRILISRPLYHSAVLTGELLVSLIKGTSIRFYSDRFDPSAIIIQMRDYGITVFCGTPTLLYIISKFKERFDGISLKHICISGECIGTERATKIAAAFPDSSIYHVYGLSEASPRVSYLPPELFLKHPECVGIPLRSVSIKIIDEHGKECPSGVEGELLVKGENIMLGYYKEPEKTSNAIKNGWLFTGDIAVINNEGLLTIKGRKDDMIIRSGMNIYPSEIESSLRSDPRVKDVLAYGSKDNMGDRICIKIVGDFSSVREIKLLCSKCLPDFQIPDVIELVPFLNRSPSGKIIRRSKNDRA